MNDLPRLGTRSLPTPWTLAPLRPTAFVLTVAALLLAGAAAGCRNDEATNNSPSASSSPDLISPAPGQSGNVGDAVRTGKLNGLPPVVQQGVSDDLGQATITSVKSAPSEAGVIYRVGYIESGTPRIATYDSFGKRLAAPGSSTTAPAEESAAPGPATAPIRPRSGG